MTESTYKTGEKKDFSPEEYARAKTTCEFVIELIKAISRSGYYDADHPVSLEVKKGLYDAFKNALNQSAEIMLSCHEYEDQLDIHISGILDEPFNIRKLTHAITSDLFVPKLKDYFERKSLNSFVIKKYITLEHFEAFIDIMSEPVSESADASQLGEHLTKALVDHDITEVSTVFKTDIVLSRGKLPWRVSIILRRLAKDLKLIPMFRSASADKMKQIKKQIVEDIVRPLHQSDLLRDLIINCDIIVNHITHLLEINELEYMIIDALPQDSVVPVSMAVFDIFKENKAKNDQETLERNVYLANVLNIAAKRIVSGNIPYLTELFEKLYEEKIVGFEMLPEEMRLNLKKKEIAREVISDIKKYIGQASEVSSIPDIKELIATFKNAVPELIMIKEWLVIQRIAKALIELSVRKEDILKESPAPLCLPDAVFEGSEKIIANEFIHADKNLKKEIGDLIIQFKTIWVKIISFVIDQSQESDVLKFVIEMLSQKGESSRQWAMKILNDKNQPLAIINIALLVIINVGRIDDVKAIRAYVKNSNASVRIKALSAMTKLNKKDAENVVIESLKDGEEKVRKHAASLILHELSLSQASINKILLFVKDKVQNKNITENEAGFIAVLLKALGKFEEGCDEKILESEIIGIASDLLQGRKGILKFMKTDLNKEQQEMICACVSTLGQTGGIKSKEFLKTLMNGDNVMSRTAQEAIAEMGKKTFTT